MGEQSIRTHVGFVESIEQAYPLGVLQTLLQDHTTGKNILWADDEYEALGEGYMKDDEITTEKVMGVNSGVIKPRVIKETERQSLRTKSHAEVFTPSWLCNQMNNYLDEEWFGRKDVFNAQDGILWEPTTNPVQFGGKRGKTWQDYVDLRKLEITCGEAPFICSRYDSVTGDMLPVEKRIGFLDRKLRVVRENAKTFDDWLKWAYRALESTYGYEYQGDNLLIARINVLQTFAEHMQDTWGKAPEPKEAKRAATIISWNLWQMDGLTGCVPSDKPVDDAMTMSIFDFIEDPQEQRAQFCQIYDWRARKPQTYVSMRNEGALA